LEKENLEKLYDVLKKMGYHFNIPIKREDFIDKGALEKLAVTKNMKVVSFYNSKDPFKIIDIGVNLPGASKILQAKKNIKVGDLSIPTILIENLIEMKEELARPKDLIDVENLKKIKKYEKRNG
jgi:hypothetical protein